MQKMRCHKKLKNLFTNNSICAKLSLKVADAKNAMISKMFDDTFKI